MIEWLDDFYADPGLRSTLLKSFLPVFSNYVAEATGGPVAASFVQALAESYVDRHLGSSRSQLQEVVKGSADPVRALAARFDEWEEKRPGKVAANELVRSANAAQVEKMREAGVEKKVWSASGGACPFCQELDGVVVSVDGTFFEEGDELNPEGVTAPIHFESDIGHPPIHQGCTCSVVAELSPGQTSLGLEAESRGDIATSRLQELLPNAEIDLTGIDDRLAPEIASAMEKMEAEFPGIAAKINRIETTTFDGSASTAYAEVINDAGGIGEGGRFVRGTGQSTIKLNLAQWGDGETMAQNLKIGEVMGWSPPGANNPESIIVHEFGHIVDANTKAGLNRQYLRTGREGELISRYAAENYGERFAENFRAIYYTPESSWNAQVKALDSALSRQRGK